MGAPPTSIRRAARATSIPVFCLVLGTGAVARAQDAPPIDVPSTPELEAPKPPPSAPTPPAAPAATPAPASAPEPAPAAAPAPTPTADITQEPLAGFSNGTAFLRAPDNSFILLPNGRLQIDNYFFKSANSGLPKNTFLLKRARLELNGWVGRAFYFSIAADFASAPPSLSTSPAVQTNLNTTDDYIAFAPWGDLAIFQIGQYDAPFTLENRTSDKYFDFMERSVTVRAFGIPSNKEQGLMVHGTNAERNYYYSLAVLNGDGQNFRNVDNQFDAMGRAWFAPLSFGAPAVLHDITLGGSFWTGDRSSGLALANQTTQGGFTILNTGLSFTDATNKTPIEVHQQGRLNAFALELNAPIAHKAGLRVEYVNKNQPLSAVDVTNAKTPVIIGGMRLKGWSTYGELWFWAIGDDRIIGEPGMQMPTRLKKFGVKPLEHGLMIAVRVDYLDEQVTEAADAMLLMLKAPSVGTTKVIAPELGINYWLSRRFRATFNYVLNHFDGTTSYIKGLKSKNEHEFGFRFAIAL
jgi:hypothetical protein